MAGPNEWTPDSLRALLARVSPGPWIALGAAQAGAVSTGRPDGKRLYVRRDTEPASDSDVAFIALARTALPRLLTAVDRDDEDISESDLASIDRIIAAASPSPWIAFIEEEEPIGGSSMIWIGDKGFGADMYVLLEGDIAPAADIKFIAAARQQLPVLVDVLRARRGRIRHNG